jgi:uncharacterized protein with LGFP repeats
MCVQPFDGGGIVASSDHGTHVLPGQIGRRWFADADHNGGFSSPMGAPTADAVCAAGWCSQTFVSGALIALADQSQTAMAVPGFFFDTWSRAGGLPKLGRPVSEAFCGLANYGCGQHFQYGSIYATGVLNQWPYYTLYSPAITVTGAIQGKFAAQGWETGSLGVPSGGMFCGLRNGGCGQHFYGGSIYWSTATGAHPVSGAIRAAWAARGWETSALGYPTSDMFCRLRNGGCGQHFQGGSIYWSTSTGAHPVTGAIRSLWAARGWETSSLGYPTADAVPAGRGRYTQRFQGGWLTA